PPSASPNATPPPREQRYLAPTIEAAAVLRTFTKFPITFFGVGVEAAFPAFGLPARLRTGARVLAAKTSDPLGDVTLTSIGASLGATLVAIASPFEFEIGPGIELSGTRITGHPARENVHGDTQTGVTLIAAVRGLASARLAGPLRAHMGAEVGGAI